MLITNAEEKQQWIKTFNRKFSHFAHNAPIAVSFDSSDGKVVEVVAYTPNRVVEVFPIDFEKDVSDFIAEIKRYMQNQWYPVITDRIEEVEDLSSIEITNIMIEKDISFEEALRYRRTFVREIPYRLDKVFNDQNGVVLTNLITGESQRYRASIPIAYIVERILEEDNKRTAEAILLKSIEPIKKTQESFHDSPRVDSIPTQR